MHHGDHATSTAEAFAVLAPLDIALVRIGETFGENDLDQVITALSFGADPETVIDEFNAAQDFDDEQSDFSATVAALAEVPGPELLRAA